MHNPYLISICLSLAACTSSGEILMGDGGNSIPDASPAPDALANCLDLDGDRYGEGEGCDGPDCAPNDPERNPGREEVCDTVDNNCIDGVDELAECELPRLWVFVLAGQSNMVGLGINSELSGGESGAVANTYIYYNSSVHNNPNGLQWRDLGPGFGATTDHFGPELKAGRQMQAHWPGRSVALIKVAEGGTGLHDRWDAPTGDLYQLLQSEVQAQMADLSMEWRPQIMGFMWMQGETDAISSSASSAYHGNLRALMNGVRESFDLKFMPLVAGLIAIQDLWPHADAVRAATSLLSQELGQMDVVETTDLPRHAADLAHYDTSGNLLLGQRMADTMVVLLPREFHFAADFGAAQGDQFWQYRQRAEGSSVAMIYDPPNSRWQGDDANVLIGAGWMHPSATRDAELAWWAPYAGLAEIQVSVSAADNGGGDGTWVEIARDGTVIWGPTAIPNGATEQITLQRFVLQGQELEFRTSAGSAHDASNDTTTWQIDITMLSVDG